jgi:hypothetical protein
MEGLLSGSTISVNRLLVAALCIAALLLSACGTKEVVVNGNFPEPLMDKLPLRLGVWYGDDFRNHEFFDEAKSRSESEWLVKTGDAQVAMWDTLLPGMFREVMEMRAAPAVGELNPVVDAVLIPHVDELQYAIPAHTSVKVYEIWMRYRYELVTSHGDPIAEWSMTAYGKTPTAFLQSDEEAVNLAAVIALRDAGANFATNFTRVPAVQDWLQEKWARSRRSVP